VLFEKTALPAPEKEPLWGEAISASTFVEKRFARSREKRKAGAAGTTWDIPWARMGTAGENSYAGQGEVSKRTKTTGEALQSDIGGRECGSKTTSLVPRMRYCGARAKAKGRAQQTRAWEGLHGKHGSRKHLRGAGGGGGFCVPTEQKHIDGPASCESRGVAQKGKKR